MHGGAEGRVCTPRDSPLEGGRGGEAGIRSSRFSCGSGAVIHSPRFSGGGWGGDSPGGGAGINCSRFSWLCLLCFMLVCVRSPYFRPIQVGAILPVTTSGSP